MSDQAPADAPLAGLNAVVTGASRGIGEAVARRLAAEGANVVVNSSGAGGSDPGPTRAVAASIDAAGGGRAIAHCGSVADFEYAAELIDACVQAFGSIDVLANIAGIVAGPDQSFAGEPTRETWEELIAVHLTGTFNCARHAAARMRERGGSIVNTSSHSFIGAYGGSGYAAGKGGVNSLTWGMARDLRPRGIRVNAIAPGARTDMASGEGYEAQIRDLFERGVLTEAMRDASLRVAGPEYVAPMYAWLASPASAGVSGQIFSVSGNYVGRFPKPREVGITERPNDAGPWSLADLDERVGARLESERRR